MVKMGIIEVPETKPACSTLRPMHDGIVKGRIELIAAREDEKAGSARRMEALLRRSPTVECIRGQNAGAAGQEAVSCWAGLR